MTKKKTTEQCIVDFRKVHGDKFIYTDVVYDGRDVPVNIICRIHGVFPQTPHHHLQGEGCPYCAKNRKLTNEDFRRRSYEIHKDNYNYTKTDVDNRDENGRVIITCHIHGDFKQDPIRHLVGYGCQKCAVEKRREMQKYTVEEFEEKAKIKHFGKNYKYHQDYIDCKTKIIITCRIHGDFSQKPNDHLNGEGCPFCKSSHLEQEIRLLLNNNDVIYEEQKNFDWLGRQSLDFYLPQYNIAIECQGIQHFKPINYWGGEERLEKTMAYDKTKLDLCINHGIRIFYYANYDYDFPYDVFTDKNKLITEINKWQEPSITTDTADSETTEISGLFR